MDSDLQKRVKHLGGVWSRPAKDSFETRVRDLAKFMRTDPELLVRLTWEHEATLSGSVDDERLVTWPAFYLVYDLLKAYSGDAMNAKESRL